MDRGHPYDGDGPLHLHNTNTDIPTSHIMTTALVVGVGVAAAAFLVSFSPEFYIIA